MTAKEMRGEEDLVQLGLRVPASYKAWLTREAATRTLSTGKAVRESDLVRELILGAMKKSTKKEKGAIPTSEALP